MISDVVCFNLSRQEKMGTNTVGYLYFSFFFGIFHFIIITTFRIRENNCRVLLYVSHFPFSLIHKSFSFFFQFSINGDFTPKLLPRTKNPFSLHSLTPPYLLSHPLLHRFLFPQPSRSYLLLSSIPFFNPLFLFWGWSEPIFYGFSSSTRSWFLFFFGGESHLEALWWACGRRFHSLFG